MVAVLLLLCFCPHGTIIVMYISKYQSKTLSIDIIDTKFAWWSFSELNYQLKNLEFLCKFSEREYIAYYLKLTFEILFICTSYTSLGNSVSDFYLGPSFDFMKSIQNVLRN